MQIYITKNGNQTGPFTEEQTRGMISAGMISHDDLAWIEGAADWKPLSVVLGISQPPPIPNSAPSVVPGQPLIKSSDGPTGVGGWLVFFCVGLTILGPLFSFGQMVSGWEQAEPAFSRFPTIKSVLMWENLGSTAILIYGFIVGCMIWSGSPQGRAIARRFLLIRLFGFIAVEVIAILIMGDLPSEVVTAGMGGVVGALFREGVYFTIWWFYFKKSKRVRNTYGHE
ncbi:MAG: DUF2569 family protein [Opitutaceae bacterium]|nr:DUF2569 family protein [Opitutaceae bacterium]